MKNIRYISIIIFGLFLSCNKLDLKPDLSRVVPSTLDDFQGLLDNTLTAFNINYPNYGEIGGGDFYVSYPDFESNFSPITSEIYKWNITDLDDPYNLDWNQSFTSILQCNIILEGLANFSNPLDLEFQNVKGQALFHRAHSFYKLVEEFAPVYAVENLKKPAIPLRTGSDINVSYPLSTIEETYNIIVEDLVLATSLLPDIPLFKTRPSKSAAFGLLARVYLAMDDYPNALKYADAYLSLNSELMDFNLLDKNADFPIKQFNSECIFHGTLAYDDLLTRNVLIVSTEVYSLYADIDLRKNILFFERADGKHGFKGNYNGLDFSNLFGGIATDEIYLIQAECHVRLNNPSSALNSINMLLEKRYDKKYFIPLAITNKLDLLKTILEERRKELLFRGLRWTDLRRLNKDPKYASILTRELNGVIYTLSPNDSRYIFPIPKYVSTIKY